MKKLLSILPLLVLACACSSSVDAPQPEKRAPRVDVGGENASTQMKPLCQHAYKLYWESEAGSDEEARAEDMIEAFCCASC